MKKAKNWFPLKTILQGPAQIWTDLNKYLENVMLARHQYDRFLSPVRKDPQFTIRRKCLNFQNTNSSLYMNKSWISIFSSDGKYDNGEEDYVYRLWLNN